MNTQTFARWRPVLSLLIVLLVAAIMRLGEPGIVRYEYDEMQVTVLAKDMVAGRDFPLEGIIASVGLPNPPLTIYLAAIPYVFSSDPMIATLFVALTGVIGVGLLWGFTRRYLGPTPAFFAGLVYAVNPWAIMFSRKIWAQSLLVLPVIALFWLGMLGFTERKRWAQILFWPVLAVIAQIHYSGVLLIPAAIWFVWHGRRDLAWRALIAGLILAGLLALPFAVGVTRFSDDEWDHYQDSLNANEERWQPTTDPLIHLHRLVTGLEMAQWWTPQQTADGRDRIGAPAPLWELLAVAALAGAVIVLRRPADRRAVVPLALWIGLPVVLFAPGWTAVHFHYFLFVIPALAILIGVGVDWLITRRARWLQAVTLIALALILLTQARGWFGLLHYVDTHATPDGIGAPLHFLDAPRDALAAYDDVLIVNDTPWTWRSMLLNVIGSVREASLPGGELVVVPEGPFAVVAPIDAADHVYQSTNFQTFPLRPDEGGYRVDRFDEGFTWPGAAAITAIEPARFDNGVTLIGYARDDHGVTLAWQLPAAQRENYQYFIHFLDTDGNRIAQVDSLFWPGVNWRRGDRIYIRYTVDWPPETRHLYVGLYQLRGDTFINNNVIDANGTPLQPWVDIEIE